jgi:hypothetical protein
LSLLLSVFLYACCHSEGVREVVNGYTCSELSSQSREECSSMQIHKSRFLKLCLSAMLISGIALGTVITMAGVAKAATCTLGTPCSAGGVGITITGGALSATTNTAVVNNGVAISATGSDQSIPFRFLTQVSDTRGTAVGWHASATSSAVSFGSTGITSDLILDPVTPVVVSCAGNSTCVRGTLTLAAPAADLVTAPVTLVSAAVSSGLGTFNVNTQGSFALPASAGAGTATGGDIAVTVDTAP